MQQKWQYTRGHVMTFEKNGIGIKLMKRTCIKNWPVLSNVKEVRAYLGIKDTIVGL